MTTCPIIAAIEASEKNCADMMACRITVAEYKRREEIIEKAYNKAVSEASGRAYKAAREAGHI